MSLAATLSRNRSKIGAPVRQQLLVFGFLGFLVLALLGPMMTFTEMPTVGDGNPLRQILYVLLFGLFVYAVRPLSDPSRLMAVTVPMLVALAWCWLSILWAIDPAIAARRVGLTTIVIWSIFLVVRQLTIEQTMTILRLALVAALLANWIAVLAFPAYGIHQVNSMEDKQLVGDWRGILMHKNIAGSFCAVTVLAFTFDAKRLHWAIRLAVIAAAGVFLFYSQSKTSGGMVIGALLVGLMMERYKSRYRPLVIGLVFIVSIVATLILFIYKDPLHSNLSDPKAFTGRMQIWTALFQYASDNLFLGTGFGSFWNIGNDSPVFHYATGWVRDVSSGHCGYLDLLVTIGVVGLLLVFFAMIVWPTLRLLSLPVHAPVAGAMPFSILFFGSGQNATETGIFDRDVLMNVFMLISVALIEQIVVRYREQPNQSIFKRAPISGESRIFDKPEHAR